jgi:hypothetical protein
MIELWFVSEYDYEEQGKLKYVGTSECKDGEDQAIQKASKILMCSERLLQEDIQKRINMAMNEGMMSEGDIIRDGGKKGYKLYFGNKAIHKAVSIEKKVVAEDEDD